MSDQDERASGGWIIRRRHLPVLVMVLAVAMLCVGVTGIYAGSAMQSTRNDLEVDGLRGQLASQKLEYEQRLGTQSAQYATDVTNFGKAVEAFGLALRQMNLKNDRRAEARERAQAEALLAAQRAAAAASATASKTDQILLKQDAVQRQVTEVATAAKATERRIETAVRPTAVVSPQPWSAPGGH